MFLILFDTFYILKTDVFIHECTFHKTIIQLDPNLYVIRIFFIWLFLCLKNLKNLNQHFVSFGPVEIAVRVAQPTLSNVIHAIHLSISLHYFCHIVYDFCFLGGKDEVEFS